MATADNDYVYLRLHPISLGIAREPLRALHGLLRPAITGPSTNFRFCLFDIKKYSKFLNSSEDT